MVFAWSEGVTPAAAGASRGRRRRVDVRQAYRVTMIWPDMAGWCITQ